MRTVQVNPAFLDRRQLNDPCRAARQLNDPCRAACRDFQVKRRRQWPRWNFLDLSLQSLRLRRSLIACSEVHQYRQSASLSNFESLRRKPEAHPLAPRIMITYLYT